MKQEIEKFKINGKIYIWKYIENQRNYPGWNISFNKIVSGNLFDLFSMIENSKCSLKKSIQTDIPSKSQLGIANNQNGMAKCKSKFFLLLNYRNDESSLWQIIENDQQIEIRFGQEKLTEFKNAVLKMANDVNDFAIYSDDENCLYFW